jgi:hypothetical protein
MVQVDVFWSYGIGSSFALGAFRQLRKLQAERGSPDEKFGPRDLLDLRRMVKDIEKAKTAFNNEYSLKNILFLSLLFVPSGSVLLWSNPSWETMQVGKYKTIPQWLVGIFTTTNVTQGMLGFWVTYNYLMRGKYYRAALQTVLSYIGFFFILINGWDNKGYQRFFSKDRESFENWKWTNVFPWLTSDVVMILGVYGVMFIPLMLHWITKWLVEGYEMDGKVDFEEGSQEELLERVKLAAFLLFIIFAGTGGPAVLATILIRWLGWTKGLAVLGAIGIPVLLGAGPWIAKKLLKVDSLDAPSVWEPLEDELPERELAEVSA